MEARHTGMTLELECTSIMVLLVVKTVHMAVLINIQMERIMAGQMHYQMRQLTKTETLLIRMVVWRCLGVIQLVILLPLLLYHHTLHVIDGQE